MTPLPTHVCAWIPPPAMHFASSRWIVWIFSGFLQWCKEMQLGEFLQAFVHGATSSKVLSARQSPCEAGEWAVVSPSTHPWGRITEAQVLDQYFCGKKCLYKFPKQRTTKKSKNKQEKVQPRKQRKLSRQPTSNTKGNQCPLVDAVVLLLFIYLFCCLCCSEPMNSTL